MSGFRDLSYALLFLLLLQYTTALSLCETTSNAVTRDVADPLTFCKFWTAGHKDRTHSPLKDLTPAQVTKACKCLLTKPSPTSTSPEINVQFRHCNASDGAIEKYKTEVRDPIAFCGFWTASPMRTRSPFRGLSTTDLSKICTCAAKTPSLFEPQAASLTGSTTSTRTNRPTKSGSASLATHHPSSKFSSSIRHFSSKASSSLRHTSSETFARTMAPLPSNVPGADFSTRSILQSGTSSTVKRFIETAPTSTFTMVFPTWSNPATLDNLKPGRVEVKFEQTETLQKREDITMGEAVANRNVVLWIPPEVDSTHIIQNISCSSEGIWVEFRDSETAQYASKLWEANSPFTTFVQCPQDKLTRRGTLLTTSSNISKPHKNLRRSVSNRVFIDGAVGNIDIGLRNSSSNFAFDASMRANMNALAPSVQSPWGLAQRVSTFSGPTSGDVASTVLGKAAIIEDLLLQPLPAPNSVDVFCVKCSIGTDLHVQGNIDMSSGSVSNAALSLNGDIVIEMNIGMSIMWPMEMALSFPLLKVALPGYNLNNFYEIVPVVTVGMSADSYNIPLGSIGQMFLGNRFGLHFENFNFANAKDTNIGITSSLEHKWNASGQLEWYNGTTPGHDWGWSFPTTLSFDIVHKNKTSTLARLDRTPLLRPVPRYSDRDDCATGTLQGSYNDMLSWMDSTGETTALDETFSNLPNVCFGTPDALSTTMINNPGITATTTAGTPSTTSIMNDIYKHFNVYKRINVYRHINVHKLIKVYKHFNVYKHSNFYNDFDTYHHFDTCNYFNTYN
ncbi:hypothetical protein K461DRAFT_322701 [Myriangium duriaei CBS 260.36]|uniref:Uncharacterized protein n=1 Tax=Myriangium duriaei CBS 260.36 TaxID=1168546 RepID=A0A9P4IXH8_9PEZI|nr:hypothetical protein K461DRAFT_322701 [Myriangium duriaei CBS 260.36]